MDTLNNRIQGIPGDQREPGDVYMMLTPEGQVQAVSVNDLLYKNFDQFVNDCAYYMLNDWKEPYPNSFFVHYRFEDPTRIWSPNENIAMFPNKLLRAVRDEKLRPLQTCRLYPVLYCLQKHHDLRNISNIINSPDYRYTVNHYAGWELRGQIRSYTGIQTDKGVSLFDNTEQGEVLQQEYKDFFVANFFDSCIDATFMRMIELIPDKEQLAKVNPALQTLWQDESTLFGQVPEKYYLNMDQIGVYTENQRYDLAPTLENFIQFSGLGNGETPSMRDETYNISCLLYLSSPQCNDPIIQDDFPNFFYYGDRFNPLWTRFDQAANDHEKELVMKDVRKLAGQILEQDFSHRRSHFVEQKGPKAQQTTSEKNLRHLPDVVTRLASQKKKKKGIVR